VARKINLYIGHKDTILTRKEPSNNKPLMNLCDMVSHMLNLFLLFLCGVFLNAFVDKRGFKVIFEHITEIEN
jgi:hypothetical protein